MSARAAIDVSELPELSFGHGASVWWGVLGLIAIESTMFALLAMSYFYLRQNAPEWPPAGTPWPALGPASGDLALELVSLAPMAWAHRRARQFSARGVVIGLSACTLLSLGALGFRVWEFGALHARWDENAYGSISWSILGMHTGHLVTSTIENVLLILVMGSRSREDKHFVDVTVNALYWYFVVAAWVALYAVVFLVPRWF